MPQQTSPSILDLNGQAESFAEARHLSSKVDSQLLPLDNRPML